MKYCVKCGNEMTDNASFCDKCGCPMNASTINTTPDIPSTGLKILCFFIPIVGLILYLTSINTQPISAKAYGKFALIGFIVSIALSIIVSILTFMIGMSLYRIW